MDITLLNPLFWITVLIGFSIFLKKKRSKNILRNIGIILFLVMTNNGLSSCLFDLWEYQHIELHDISEPFDIGIVLGPFIWPGNQYPNGMDIIEAETPRFFQARQLYKQGKIKKILLSGDNNVDFAQSYLIGLGIPSSDILIEGKSKNTYENALLSKRLLAQQGTSSNKLLLITSAYHMRRAKMCFDKVGLKVTPFSVDFWTPRSSGWNLEWSDIIPNFRALRKWNMLTRELTAMLYFKLKNYI